MKQKRIRLSLKGLTRRDLLTLRRLHHRWRKKIQPLQDAIRASERITGDDLKMIVR